MVAGFLATLRIRNKPGGEGLKWEGKTLIWSGLTACNQKNEPAPLEGNRRREMVTSTLGMSRFVDPESSLIRTGFSTLGCSEALRNANAGACFINLLCVGRSFNSLLSAHSKADEKAHLKQEIQPAQSPLTTQSSDR
jgi:hypothetical protein